MASEAVLRVKVIADTAQAALGLDKVDSSAGRMRAGLAKAAVPAAAAATAIIAFGKASFDAASRAQQAMGGVDAVFGKSAKAVHKWAQSSADDVGLAASEYEELATVLGAQLKNAGVPMEDIAKKSKTLIKTGADLSAQFGGTAKEAVEALSSALRGETDPIEKYGVAVKQADIAARMAADGTDKLEGNAAKQAKTAALLALVTEQTADAHGAFAREADTAAGQSQRTAAKMEDMQATLGQALLPVITTVVEALGGLFTWMEKNQTATTAIIAVIGALAAAIIVMNVALAVTALLSAPIALVALAFVALAVAVVVAYKKVGWFRDFVDSSFAVIKTIIGAVGRFLVSSWENSVNAVRAVIRTVENVWDTTIGGIRSAVSSVTGWIERQWDSMVGAVKTVIKGVETAWDTAVAGIRSLVTEITGFLETRWGNAVENVKGIIRGLQTAAENVLGGIRSAIDSVWNVFRGLGSKIQGLIGSASGWLFSIGADIIRGLINGINSMIGQVASAVQALADKIPGWVKKRLGIGSPSKVMAAIGKDVNAGLIKGMEDGLSGIKAISEAVADTVSATMEKRFKSDKRAAQASAAVIKAAADETRALEKNAIKRQKIYKELAAAQENLAAIQEERAKFAEGITSSTGAFGAITNLADKEQTTARGILDDMHKRVADAADFQATLATLAAAGLNQKTLADLAQAGVDGGLAVAQGLAAGGPAALAEANALQAQLDAIALTMGTDTATAMYAAGEKGAQAIVDGLEIKQENLEEWAETLAEKLAKALKRAIRKAVKGATGGGGGGGGGGGSSTLSAVPSVASASAAPAVPNSRALGGSASVAGPTIVVNGALDPEAVARQINRILRGHDRRMGLSA